MSQSIVTTPRPKATYRILFSPGDTPTQGGNVLRKIPKVVRTSNVSDLDAAVSSITGETVNDANHVEKTPVTTTLKKNFTTPNIMTLNSADSGGKLEKILFFPKYFQKKVTVLDSKKPIKRDTITPTVQTTSTPVPKAKFSFVSQQKEKDYPTPKKRKLGDIALESWQNQKKATPISASPAYARPPAPAPTSTKLLCRLCGNAIEDEVVELVDTSSGDVTMMGAKLKTIIRHDLADSRQIPNGCCKPCSYKVHVCFSLMVELQAADEVMTSAYNHEDSEATITHQMYTCQECDQEVMGMSDFIQHHESHVHERTVGVESEPSTIGVEKNKSEFNADTLISEALCLMEESVEDDGLPSFQNELGEYVCELCGRTFKHMFLLVLHRKAPRRGRKNPKATPVIEEAAACFICGEMKTDASQSVQPCEKCQAAADEEENDDNSENNGMKQCDICFKDVMNKTYARHRLSHGDSRFFCDECGKGFSYKYSLRKHLQYHDRENNKEVEIGFSDFNCEECSMKFKTPREYRKHMKKVHGEQVTCLSQFLSCPKCTKSYPDMFRLRVHMRVIHRVEVPFRQRIGGRVRQIECDVCGKILNSENSTRIHMREEHGLRNKDMRVLKQECEVCGKIFSVKQNLIHHINSAHLNIKPMPCDICGERFGKHSSLIFHRLRHTGEKPFQCTVCLKTYRQRNDVIRHLARHVRDKDVDYETAHAVNTSSSKFVSKRYIYLKDSTIKGLMDMARSDSLIRRKSTVRAKPALEEVVQTDQQAGQVYEEVVFGEGGSVLISTDENSENRGEGTIRYVMADNSEMEYVVPEGEEENVEYVIEGEAGSGSYVLSNAEDGEVTYVDADGKTLVVVKDEEGDDYVKYILKTEGDEDVEENENDYPVTRYYDEDKKTIIVSRPSES